MQFLALPCLSGTVSIANWDESIFQALNLAGKDPILDALMVAVTSLALPYVLALLAVPLWWRGHRELAVDLLVLLAVTIVVTEILKYGVGRPRPCDVIPTATTIPWDSCASETDPSFPSGHASRIFVVAALLALHFRWPVKAGGFAVAFAVGLSRIYLGVHWPSDVLGGALVGIVLALGLALVERRTAFYVRIRGRLVAAIARVLPSRRRS